ncbi:hypothetical protein JCM8547_000648 [Rhodosporidiobolus lusitaniae]
MVSYGLDDGHPQPLAVSSIPQTGGTDSLSSSRSTTPLAAGPKHPSPDFNDALRYLSPSPTPTYRTTQQPHSSTRPPLPTIPLAALKSSALLAMTHSLSPSPSPPKSLTPTGTDLTFVPSSEVDSAGVPKYEIRPRRSSLAARTARENEKRLEAAAPALPAGGGDGEMELLRERFDSGRANVERWRSAQAAPPLPLSRVGSGLRAGRRDSDAQSVSSYGSGGTMLSSSRALEGMTDAEIAQHHFRLAQQHLEAAQRLAMAAAAQPGRPSPSAPSGATTASSESQPAPFDLMSNFDGESCIDPTETLSSPVSPHSTTYDDAASEFGKLSVHDAVDASGFSSYRLSRSLSSLHPSSWSESAPSPGILSTSAASTRSAPTPRTTSAASTPAPSVTTAAKEGPAHPVFPPRRPQPPAQPPRRTTALGAMAMTPMESASTLQPSLYGGGLPPGVLDRIGNTAVATRSAPSPRVPAQPEPQLQHVERSGAGDGMTDDDLVGSGSEGGHGGREDGSGDFDDAASDFQDAQSVFSHVTYATLPPYEAAAGTPPPPVPALPSQFAAEAAANSRLNTSYASQFHQHQPSEPTLPSAAPSAPPRPSLARASASEDDFHGFRPRLGAAPAAPVATNGPRTVVNAPSPYAASPSTPTAFHPYALASPASSAPPPAQTYRQVIQQQQPPHAYVAPAQATAHLQPHSYILGPNGQPIPVYAAPSAFPVHSSAPPSAVVAAGSRQPLAVHAQPLQYDHSLPYYSARQVPAPVSNGNTGAVYQSQPPPSAPSHPVIHPSTSSASLPQSFHSAPSAPPAPSITFSSSNGSTVSGGSTIRRPSSADSTASGNTTFSTATTSTALKNRMASLRSKMVRSPHVRFKSPDPEGNKARAVGGGGGGGKSKMGSVFEDDDEEGGDLANMNIEQRMAKQKKAMQMSMGMLM